MHIFIYLRIFCPVRVPDAPCSIAIEELHETERTGGLVIWSDQLALLQWNKKQFDVLILKIYSS